MKNYYLLLLLPLLFLWNACDPEPAEEKQGVINSDDTTEIEKGTENRWIDVSTAKTYSQNWLAVEEVGIKNCTDKVLRPVAYTVKREDLDTLPTGANIYFAINDDDTLRLVLVARNSDGTDDDTTPAKFRDFSAPCPRICDVRSTIFNCDNSSFIPLGVTVRRINGLIAARWARRWRDLYGIPGDCSVNSQSQVKGYQLTQNELDAMAPAGVDSIIGIRLYFAREKADSSSTIFLMASPVKDDNSDIVGTDGYYRLEAVCNEANCNCTIMTTDSH